MKTIGHISWKLIDSQNLNSEESLELFRLNHALLVSLNLSISIVDKAN